MVFSPDSDYGRVLNSLAKTPSPGPEQRAIQIGDLSFSFSDDGTLLRILFLTSGITNTKRVFIEKR